MNVAFSLVLHLLGVVLWVGGLLAMSRVLVAQAKEPGPGREALGRLAGRFNVLSLVGFVLTAGSGLYQLSLWGMEVFKRTRWMHHKLTAVLVLCAVHGVMWSTQAKWARLGPDAKLPRGQAAGLHGSVGLLLIAILALVFFGRLGG